MCLISIWKTDACRILVSIKIKENTNIKWANCLNISEYSAYDRNNQLWFSINKIVLKKIQNLPDNSLWWSLFLIKVQGKEPALSLKRDSCINTFLWLFWNFQENFFYITPLGYCHFDGKGDFSICFHKESLNEKR